MLRRAFVRSSAAAAVGVVLPRPSFPFRLVTQDPGDVPAVNGDGHAITLRGAAIKALASRLRGRVLLAGDEGYEQARQILNPTFDKHPALVAQVTGAADVRAAVEFAAEHGVLLAVKCGGHSFSGKSTCDQGMMIDLSPFRDVRVDPEARRARVTGGSLLGAVDHESMAYGLVTPMGTVSHTGAGGLVTGGGFGRLARRFGLSIDNLLSVDVVTADGRLVHASADEHPDLFWGVRGGGGNFGIVTSFEFRLHPMERQVVGGDILYPIERARDALAVYAEYAPAAPDDLYSDFFAVRPPGGAPAVVGFSVCYSGPPARADTVLAPFRSLGTPIDDGIQAVDYVALQRSGDNADPRARGVYLKSAFLPAIPDALITAIVDGLEGHPARTSIVAYQQSGGAISRVPNAATAFAHRDAVGNLLGIVNWAHGEDPSAHIGWMRKYWATLEPFAQGFYANDAGSELGRAAIDANYRENFPRLVEVKNAYDPTNLFRLNANVEPTA